MHHEIIDAMDNHLVNNINDQLFTPATGYNTFCQNNSAALLEEIKRLLQEEKNISIEDLKLKFKKTYKNRYYILTREKF